jgi:sphinganine-1-phosphate aldolase
MWKELQTTIIMGFLYFLYKNHKYLFFYIYSKTPKGKTYILSKKTKAIENIKNNVFKTKWKRDFNEISDYGLPILQIKGVIESRKQPLNNKISGTIYNNKDTTQELAAYIYNLYMYSNPLHSDLFPELNKMESEIVKMVGDLFDLPESGGGNLTTGGTESTICAIKAYKKLKTKESFFNISRLEVLTTRTGHAAINKACELLDLKLVYVDLDDNHVMDLYDLQRKISSLTCVVIASAPCFPYGLIDPINEICEICKYRNVPLHVDACLGGFITQFDETLKLSFDKNIQSISVDPHKFGYTPKGSSLLLWKNKQIKRNQYFVVSDWCGGIYASCSLPGSRVGSQIATTWGILLHNGLDYYKNMSIKIIKATKLLKNDISEIESFEVIGDPNVNVVAFTSRTISISNIIDALEKKHWNLNILQNPLCLHICITPNNIDNLREFVEILRELTLYNLDENTNDSNLVAIYGMAAKIPDKNIVDEIVEEYLDYTTDL